MSKRRRTSSIASKDFDDDSVDSVEASTSSGPTMRKRRKMFDPMELCYQLYDIIRNHKKDDGSLLCDSFIRVPKRRQEPGYYDVVSYPIDLLKVQQKLKMDEYVDLEDLQDDIELIVNNTKAFYKKSSQEYKDANELWDLFISNKNRLTNFDDAKKTEKTVNNKTPVRMVRKSITRDIKNNVNNDADIKNTSNCDEDENPYEDLFNAVMTVKDEYGKLLHTHFQLLPSKKKYPEYYEVIEQPIDLKMVALKIQHNKYHHLMEMERDLLLMCKNACLFNEPGSQIYKQAKALRKFIQTRRTEMDAVIKIPNIIPVKNNGSSRGRFKKLRGVTVTATAALKDDESEPEPEEDEPQNNDVDLSDPKWKLFDTVSNETGYNGVPLSQPFWKLPSRRFYPDYYREIKNPMSLGQIKRKLLKRDYGNLSEVAGDLTVMFENAKKYNITTSKLYKDAVKLQRLMQTKVQQLLDIDQSFLQELDNVNVRKKPGPKPKNHLPGHTPTRGRPPKDPTALKKKLHTIAKYMLDYTTEDGRKPMLAFMEKPSKKLYPNYYEVIAEPIDFLEIESKIKAEQYSCENDLVKDFKLMFSNCREFNEENSPIYEDATLLEKYLLDQLQKIKFPVGITRHAQSSHKNNKNPMSIIRASGISRSISGSPRLLLESPRGLLGNHKSPSVPNRLGRPPKNLLGSPKVGRPRSIHSSPKGLHGSPKNVHGSPKGLHASPKGLHGSPKGLHGNSKSLHGSPKGLHGSPKGLHGSPKSSLGHTRAVIGNSKISLLSPDRIKKEKGLIKLCKSKKTSKPLTPLDKMLKTLYHSIRDFREPKENRHLSQIFMKLPSKIDYPDYYEVIKSPIDMERISQKLKAGDYKNLDELVADFILMFDNACKYNEPDSQIYKDALLLQRVCVQTKMQLKEDENTVPDVPSAVQDIFLNLFTNVYNHQDEDGRCYSDSMADLIEHDEIDGKKFRAISLDLIKRRLDKGVYKRLDIFQEDFFACMDRARRLSRLTSQIFEDAVELQTYFIQQRDELCKYGEILSSPALNFTLDNLKTVVEQERQNKLAKESLDDEMETRSSEDSLLKDSNTNETLSEDSFTKDIKDNNTNLEEKEDKLQGNVGESITCNQRTFKVGEYVYVDVKEKGCEPHILCIERLWENEGQQMLYGNYYLRPGETYHVTTRKFLEHEVFKSDSHSAVPLEEVRDRCCVVNVKQYYTMRPEGYEDKDVYVCESRYSTRHRAFKKIKIYPENPTIKLVPREVPLEPKRVMSVFKERVEKHKGELAELEEQEKLVEKYKPNVVSHNHRDIDDGNTYFEQFNTICSGVVKTGDFTYVVVDGGKQVIAQIDSIWETKDSKCYFRGPWFIAPLEASNLPTKFFYKQEVFLSSLEETNPIVSIIGKCAVLNYDDYVMLRPTEIPEQDVFICTSVYDEISHQLRKLPPSGLKKYKHSPAVTPDEIYYFTKLLNPSKVALEPKIDLSKKNSSGETEASPQLTKMNDVDVIMEDSLDGGPPSVGSGEIPVPIQTPINIITTTPTTTTTNTTPTTPATSKKKTNKNKVVTGYILYSREVRKQVVQNNPESTFGDISRIVGSEWKSLPTTEKQVWEEKASILNEETKALLLLEEQCSSPVPPPGDLIYECLWDNCDYQFEEIPDLIEHCIKDKESQGHVQAFYQENPGTDLVCHWRNCSRKKKNLQPFPNIARLIRHVRDMHINKGNGRSVAPDNRSKNFKPSSKTQAVNRPIPSATPNPPSGSTNVVTANVQKVQEPMFISVPPRPQRVLHSEAYIKYIEGLQADSRYISPWERTLTATQENTPAPDLDKLQHIATWLGNKADQHDNVVAALWTLRNQLLKNTLCLQKTL